MEPVLLLADVHSAVWQKLKKHYEARLQSLRAQNDGRLSADDTTRLRGRVAEVKKLLALGDPQAPPEPDDV